MEDVNKLISKIPDTAENMHKARVLRKFLESDEKGIVHIKEMEDGYFEKSIPDETLAAVARNFFVRWRDENKIERSYDLATLYLLVMNFVKCLILEEYVIKQLATGKFKNKEERGIMSLISTLDASYQKLAKSLGMDLAMDRRSRVQKELRTVEDGSSITMILSNKLREEDE